MKGIIYQKNLQRGDKKFSATTDGAAVILNIKAYTKQYVLL
jgi:hypothetical protein